MEKISDTMNLQPQDCCVLNSGSGAWAFEPLAVRLASFLGVEISDEPRRFNYLLNLDEGDRALGYDVFIPAGAVRLASDKRLLAAAFIKHDVPIPQTQLIDTFEEVRRFIHEHPGSEWCLKYPTSCGANGHRMISGSDEEPPNWPRPFIVQEFVRHGAYTRSIASFARRVNCLAGLPGVFPRARGHPRGSRTPVAPVMCAWVNRHPALWMRHAARLQPPGFWILLAVSTCFKKPQVNGSSWKSAPTDCSTT